MEHDTLILDLEGGTVRAIASNTLAGARVAIKADGQPERVVVVRPVAEAAIEQYVREYRACELAGAWHGLDGAGDETSAALADAAEVCAELATLLRDLCGPRQMRRDPAELLADFNALHPLRTAARASLAAGMNALDDLGAVCVRAAEIIAATGGDHHTRPRLACVR